MVPEAPEIHLTVVILEISWEIIFSAKTPTSQNDPNTCSAHPQIPKWFRFLFWAGFIDWGRGLFVGFVVAFLGRAQYTNKQTTVFWGGEECVY